MDQKSVRLVLPDVVARETFLEGLREISDLSEKFSWVYLGESVDLALPEREFEKYVLMLLERETKASPNFVTDTVYWAFVGDEMVGRISLRHELNDFLKVAGGHIGYIVRPSWRGKGIATWMLEQILQMEKAKSLGRLLLTCDETNTASEKTILKNGGVLENIVELAPGKPRKKRFWISLNK